MTTNPKNTVQNAADPRLHHHLYLRGNFQQDMFYDDYDKINVWNRLWLSARATGVQILSVKILENHLHITALIQNDDQRKKFKTHFRMSITQYHNRRYKVHGTLGMRDFKHAILKDTEDLMDCICYHIRNILHHGLSKNYLDYPFSTARYIFDLATDAQKGIYTRQNLPYELAHNYLPIREQLPEGWQMTSEGLIIPPLEIFPKAQIESLFIDRETYLETLTHRTTREANDQDEPSNAPPLRIQDQQIVEFVNQNSRIPIPSMNPNQKMEAIRQILDEYPKVSKRLLSRLFGIHNSTLTYRLRHSYKRT